VIRIARSNGAPVIAGALLLMTTACLRVPEDGLARGEGLYDTCRPCHGGQGEGNQALAAPAIGGLPQWYVEAQLTNFNAGRRGYAPYDTSGIRMKSISWTLRDSASIASVAQYVASLPAPNAPATLSGNAAAGQGTFQLCMACHGAQAEGNEALHAPPLAGRSDWYLLSQLHKFKNGWRGTDTADMWGMTMRGNAMTLDDSSMVNVLAYIHSLQASR
jgi:cytochrome c553